MLVALFLMAAFVLVPAAGLRLEQHFADWKLTDGVSGATGTVDDYLIKTISLGFLLKF